MVKQIASRAAGLRLFLIVAVLLIPVFVLGAFMLQSMQEQRSILDAELKGVAFNRLVMPIMLGGLQSRIADKDIENLKQSGAPLAVELGVEPIYDGLLKTLSAKQRDHSQVLRDTNRLLAESSESSGLILDSEAESYHLAVATTIEIPETIKDFKELQLYSYQAMSTMRMKNQTLIDMLLSVGSFGETVERLNDALERAKSNAQFVDTYNSLQVILDEFEHHMQLSHLMLEPTGPSQIKVNMQKAGEFGLLTNEVAKDMGNIWKASIQQLEQGLLRRLDNATRYMALLGSIALITSVIGVGFAASMFRSTLKQLDQVEEARRLADVARDAAEDMSEKLIVINSDMAKLNRDLESNMKQLTAAQAEIVRKTKFANLGQLTATVAHELRNPLGAVRTSAFLLERKLKDKGLGVEAQLLRINNGITRCDETITQLLDFSRSKQISCLPVDLDGWLIEVVEEEARRLPPTVNITCSLGLGTMQVPIDRARLQRAIVNTVANASEAMVGKGDLSSGSMTNNPTITIETRLAGKFVEIEVADNGPGISPENLAKVREPMFTTKNFGTGLGIPAIEQILEQHSGTLDIQSELGKGAKFIMRLPLEQILEDAA
jgi:signal transduction histidine kinase